MVESRLYNEQILELEPVGSNDANIIWEWNIKDHLIQDFAVTKNNFGNIAENPQLLDINYIGMSGGKANWLHVNSIQYYENFDQIVISTRMLSEFYIIDHSTTTAESSSHSGGNRGKGGDILYRWGNPQVYDHGDESDKILFGQHYPHFISDNLDNAGKLILFNNGFNRDPEFSQIFILNLPMSSPGNYNYNISEAYGPTSPDWIYIDPVDQTNFFSNILSSAQILPNGNTLICDGDSGYFFEIDNNNNKVWEYISPISSGNILSQGDTPALNFIFRAHKFSKDYPAFLGKDLTPGDPIELDFDLSNCEILASPDVVDLTRFIIPNPINQTLVINTNYFVEKVEVYNIQGKKIIVENRKKNINFTAYSSGIYFVKIYTDKGIVNKKIIKI